MMITYKIYRFAYTHEVNDLIVPDDAKFYCIFTSDKAYPSEVASIDGKFHNHIYIAMIPWTKEKEDGLKNAKHQTFNLEWWNIADTWIYLKLKNVCPLTDNFPIVESLSDDVLMMEPCYIKYRAMHQVLDKEKSDARWNGFLEAKKNDDVTENELANIVCPVIKYIKICAIDEANPLSFECVSITTGSWLDDRYVCKIEKENVDIDDLILSGKFYRTVASDEREFNEVKENVISNF